MSDAIVDPSELRCPICDTVVELDTAVCVMCGTKLIWPQVDEAAVDDPLPETVPTLTPVIELLEEPDSVPDVVVFEMKEQQSPLVMIVTAVFAILIFILGALVIQFRSDEVSMIIMPSVTPIPPTITYTPTWTPLPIDTRSPTQIPTITPTPAPTATPRQPRAHTVSSGETLIGLSFFYRVSTESILEANNLSEGAPIQVNQSLLVPWPTATPPLTIIAEEINGEVVLADPENCDRYEVREGDSVAGIANFFGIDLALLAKVNRLGTEAIIQPGDTLCIPEIIYGESLPPTPGPSPTPTVTAPPAGPRLLYPINETTIADSDGIITLQWVAVQDLEESEWYMVELTDMLDLDKRPLRGFTRDNGYQIPSTWRPEIPEQRQMRWRVSIVQVTDWRADGLPIYTFGGEVSDDAFFTWLGALPTATPTPTVTATATVAP